MTEPTTNPATEPLPEPIVGYHNPTFLPAPTPEELEEVQLHLPAETFESRLTPWESYMIDEIRANHEQLNCLPWHDRTPAIVLAALDHRPDDLELVPHAIQTREMALAALRSASRSHRANKIIPLINPDIFDINWISEFCERGQIIPIDLEMLPNVVWTQKVANGLCDVDGKFFLQLPDAVRNGESALHAVMTYPRIIAAKKFEPFLSVITRELAYNLAGKASLASIPDELHTYALCLRFVSLSGSSLAAVKEEWKTPEMCLAAMSASMEPGYLSDVPLKLRTPELCLRAVQSRPNNIMHVPTPIATEQMCVEAVSAKKDPALLNLIPPRYRTFSVCLAAVKRMKLNIKYVPTEHKTEVELQMPPVATLAPTTQPTPQPRDAYQQPSL
jgi:hypothetical protein